MTQRPLYNKTLSRIVRIIHISYACFSILKKRRLPAPRPPTLSTPRRHISRAHQSPQHYRPDTFLPLPVSCGTSAPAFPHGAAPSSALPLLPFPLYFTSFRWRYSSTNTKFLKKKCFLKTLYKYFTKSAGKHLSGTRSQFIK